MVARVYRRPSQQGADRLPVSTYDEAVRRLVQYRLDEVVTDEAYSLAVEVVADIFWRSEKSVLADVIKAARELGVT